VKKASEVRRARRAKKENRDPKVLKANPDPKVLQVIRIVLIHGLDTTVAK
jgi:hypothetical protein